MINLSIIKKFIHPIHPAGRPFIIGFFIVSLICYFIHDWLGNFGMIMTVWVIYFFRDPIRKIPQGDNLLISPADGLVINISKTAPPAELELEDNAVRTKVSVFLSVMDVHVNRTPITGLIKKIKYHSGKFLSAELDKASEDNERNSFVIENSEGKEIIMVQIAGLIARRIICEVKEGENLEKGSRVGLIRFGSRVDVYLPEGVEPRVWVGQKAVAGETILADLSENPKQELVAKDI